MSLIPCADEVTPQLKQTIRFFLQRFAPKWRDIPVVGAAVLLGVNVGPKAADHIYDDALQGWQN
eukprot:413383-Karenia_brevis.AAC.1